MVRLRGQRLQQEEGNGKGPGWQAGKQKQDPADSLQQSLCHLELWCHRGLHALQIQLGGVFCRSVRPQQRPRRARVLQLPAQPHACRADRRGGSCVTNRCW
jgi:hypothetical protein